MSGLILMIYPQQRKFRYVNILRKKSIFSSHANSKTLVLTCRLIFRCMKRTNEINCTVGLTRYKIYKNRVRKSGESFLVIDQEKLIYFRYFYNSFWEKRITRNKNFRTVALERK